MKEQHEACVSMMREREGERDGRGRMHVRERSGENGETRREWRDEERMERLRENGGIR